MRATCLGVVCLLAACGGDGDVPGVLSDAGPQPDAIHRPPWADPRRHHHPGARPDAGTAHDLGPPNTVSPPVPAPLPDAAAPPDAARLPDAAPPPDATPSERETPCDPSAHPSIGRSCTCDGDCGGGSFCWLAPSGEGLCTARCSEDADCGSLGFCFAYSTGQFCARRCKDWSSCPSSFACFIDIGCYPADELDCDPTIAACRTTGGAAGGCLRYARGAGRTGTCFQTCLPGRGTCPAAEDGSPQTCIVFDERKESSPGDAFEGAVCVPTGSVANDDGQPCIDADGSYAPWACLDGSQCDLSDRGDGLCHPLCEQGDACARAGCSACVDAFGLFDSSTPIGLCE